MPIMPMEKTFNAAEAEARISEAVGGRQAPLSPGPMPNPATRPFPS